MGGRRLLPGVYIRGLIFCSSLGIGTYHDICVFDVRCAGADVAMVLRELQRIFKVFVLAVLLLACEWDFGDAYILFLLHGGELLLVGYATSDRHVAKWGCVGE